jgi:mycothiol synthase
MGTSPVTIDRYVPADRSAFLELLRDPGLRAEYGRLVENGELDDPLAHPVLHPGAVWLARDGDLAIGFGMLLVIPSAHGPWAHVRLGVRSAHRRRGAGGAWLRAAEEALDAIPPSRAPFTLTAGAWLPADDAKSFLECRGFEHARSWWNMERPLGPAAEPPWPAGVELRTFDGSDHAFEEWTACYNESFAARFPSHIATVEEGRKLAAGPLFRPDGLLLAWRGDRCVGFCRDTLFPGHGEVDVLGVRPDAQGIGLGRALLRWGVDWLQAQGALHVRLIVDGENETALRLYGSEGFDIVATRGMWGRPTRPATSPA